jgi:predicted transcriptional regulator YheO
MKNFICQKCNKELYYFNIKERFIEIYKSKNFLNISALCKELGISRKTAYKYINSIK